MIKYLYSLFGGIKMNQKVAEQKSKVIPWWRIVITIVLIIMPILLKITSIFMFNESSNLSETANTGQGGGGGIIYVLMGFAMHTLSMWLIIIGLIVVSIIWINYFAKTRRE